MFDGTHHMFGLHGFGWIFWLLLLVLGGWLIARVAGRNGAARPDTPTHDPTGESASAPAPESPLDTLKQRYARGEISTDEYEERKQHLERDR